MPPTQFLLEGLDRLGKDTLSREIQDRLGYHLVLHYSKPLPLACYSTEPTPLDLRRYQEASFRTMFHLLSMLPSARIICNRAHLGECVYAPIYRKYPGDYVFGLEQEFRADQMSHVRLVLLTEDFATSKHFVDDGKGLGGPEKRRQEQHLFQEAFNASGFKDKRVVCVTDQSTGQFRSRDAILSDVLA